MSELNRQVLPGRWPRSLVAAAALSAVAGCAFFDPYVGIPAKAPDGWKDEPVQFAGHANEEIARVEAVRQDYLGRMQQMGRTKAAFATGATVLTGWALYNTLKPNAPGVTETPHGDKLRTARLGAVVGTAYGLSQYAVNKDQESAYNDGYRALTCLLRQSAPLLMPLDARGQADSKEALEADLAHLLKQIETLHKSVAAAKVGLAEGRAAALQAEAQKAVEKVESNKALPDAGRPSSRKLSAEQLSAAVGESRAALPADVSDRPGLEAQIRAAETALARARNAWSDGQALLKAVSGSGREIRERAHTIVSTINGLIHSTQVDIQAADASLTKAQDIVSGFIKIGTSTAGDQAEKAADEKTAEDKVAMLVSAAAPSAAQVRAPRLAAAGGPGLLILGGSLAAATLAGAEAAAASSAAASAARPAAKAAPKPAAAPAGTPLTVSELQKLTDLMGKTLKDAKEREAKEAQEKLVGGYVSKLKELAQPKNQCKKSGGGDRCDSAALAEGIEDLYARRRPVVATILHFRAQARAVRRISGCPSDVGVRVTPNETTLVSAGDSMTFIVNQPKPGLPVTVLQGAQGDDLAVLKTTSLGAAGMQAQIQFSKKAKGRYTLLTTDSTGEYSESVLIVVKAASASEAAEKPKPAASAASAAAP